VKAYEIFLFDADDTLYDYDQSETHALHTMFARHNLLGIANVEGFNDGYLSELGRGTFLIEGAHKVCRHLVSMGKLIFIVTNGLLATQKSRMEHSPINQYISDFFVSEVVGYKKPKRSILTML